MTKKNSFIDHSSGVKYGTYEYESEFFYLFCIVNERNKMVVEYSYRDSEGEGNEQLNIPLKNIVEYFKDKLNNIL